MLEAIDPTVVASFSEYMTYAAYALAFFPETVRWRDEAALPSADGGGDAALGWAGRYYRDGGDGPADCFDARRYAREPAMLCQRVSTRSVDKRCAGSWPEGAGPCPFPFYIAYHAYKGGDWREAEAFFARWDAEHAAPDD